MKSVRAIKTNSVPNPAINFPYVQASTIKSGPQTASILSATIEYAITRSAIDPLCYSLISSLEDLSAVQARLTRPESNIS